MLRNLKAEMARLDLTSGEIAIRADISYQSFGRKLKGASGFTLAEMRRIRCALDEAKKEILGDTEGYTLDYLFETYPIKAG